MSRSLPWRVATVKSMQRSGVTWMPLLPDSVGALGVLAEEDPVDPLRRDAHGPDVGEEVEGLAHGDVGALDVGPGVAGARRRGGALEDDMTLLQLFEDIVGDRFELGGAVLDGQPLDDPEDDLAALHLRLQEQLQHSLGLL